MKYEEGDLVICKVTNIVKTTIFVETLNGTKGSMVLSEVAPGRIRNLRAYVVPNKIIVCKILEIKGEHLFLSLRRVKDQDRKNLMNQYKKERTHESIIKKLLGAKAEEVLKKITENQTLNEFLDSAKEDLNILKNHFTEIEAETVTKLLEEKKEKEKEIKREFKLTCKESNGILTIKALLKNHEGITYLGNSKFLIRKKSTDLKKTDNEIRDIFDSLEKSARKEKCDFEVLKH
tara:strand:+ start:1780 stop:2478 length:699 start_codon:yes stop_codon:yes gene_type:complete